MSLLYGDNFQSYSVGAGSPYGDLVYYAGVVPFSIISDSAGLFGQTKSLSLPSTVYLALPNPVYDGSGPFYQQATIYEYVKLNNTIDEQGELIKFANAHTNIFGGLFNNSISGIRILSDGTLGIVGQFNSAFSPNTKVSDYSLLTKKWYLIRVDISFGSNLGFFEVLNCKIYVNGVVVVEASNIPTTVAVADFTHLYYNNILFSGAGNGMSIGGIWVYDTIQSDTFYPNPGVPSARLNQGVIELIKKRSTPVNSSNTRIYEA